MLQIRQCQQVKTNKQIKTQQMSPDIKLIILANMNVKLNIYFSQGSAATDLRGGVTFTSSLLRRSFLNLTVKII